MTPETRWDEPIAHTKQLYRFTKIMRTLRPASVFIRSPRGIDMGAGPLQGRRPEESDRDKNAG